MITIYPPYPLGGRARSRSQAAASAFYITMKTIVYVDGFNLYYGALKGTAFKWLNLDQLCRHLLPKNEIVGIKYFTATVSARNHDPKQPARQLTYLRALQTLPHLDIVYGHFLTHEIYMPRADNPTQTVKVIKTEEKGSDVNLAAHLVNDGHRRRYDVAVLITNDSDLLEPVKMVRYELNLPVGILNPQRRASWVLKQHASFIKKIRPGVLKASQFPARLRDAKGVFHKPASW